MVSYTSLEHGFFTRDLRDDILTLVSISLTERMRSPFRYGLIYQEISYSL